MSLTLCVLLWARPGAEDGLIAYEDQVLGLVSGHGGQVLQRARGTGTGGQPLEIQLPEFLSARALDAFMTDGRRQPLAGEWDRVISKTEVIEVKLVPPVPGQWTAPDRSGGFPSSGKEWQMENRFEVTVSAGTLRPASSPAVGFPHRWTPEGVTVEADFTGGHLLHLAAAGCVLNDVYREAAALGIEVKGVRVSAAGGFETGTWKSTGIAYSVDVSSDVPAGELAHLLEVVDEVAEIPRAIRAGATVWRAT